MFSPTVGQPSNIAKSMINSLLASMACLIVLPSKNGLIIISVTPKLTYKEKIQIFNDKK